MARSVNPELLEAVKRYAPTIGLTPKELLGIYSYETGGTLDPWQRGPTTKWGQHRGLIQWGEPQARQYGVSATTSIDQQVAASLKYLRDRGFRPGMGLAQAYAAVNAGGVSAKHLQARDAAAGGAPGTVLDKVNKQMGPHLARAEKLLGGGIGPPTMTASAPKVMQTAAPATQTVALPNSPLPNVGEPNRGVLADTPDPFKAIADAAEKKQVAQQAALAASQAAAQPPQIQPMAPPAPDPMQAAPPIDYAGLLMPRLKRGLLADDYSLGLLGAA